MGLRTSLNVTMQKALTELNCDYHIQTCVLTILEFMLTLALQFRHHNKLHKIFSVNNYVQGYMKYQCKKANYTLEQCTRWHSWFRHCAISQKVAGLIPDGVTGIFHSHNPSSCTVALGLTRPLAEMSTRNISWGVMAADA